MSGKKIIIAAAVLLLVLLIGGALAYFSDVDTKANTFTIGKVKIRVNFDQPELTNILPRDTIDSPATITNIGETSAYVYAEVTMPYGNLVTETAAGAIVDATDVPMFELTDAGSGWIEVAGKGSTDTTNHTITKVYAYGTSEEMTALEKNATTTNLFTNLVFANFREGQSLETTTKEVVINGYAIQTEAVGNPATRSAAGVWDILVESKSVAPATYTAYNVGDPVTLTVGGIEEDFWVIESSDASNPNVTLITKENINTTSLNQASANNIGFSDYAYWWDEENDEILSDYTDANAGLNNNPIDGHESYALTKDRAYGEIARGTGRLLTLAEANALKTSNLALLYANDGVFKSSNNYLNYWLGSADSENSNCVWYVRGGSSTNIYSDIYLNSGLCGVRPVVTISKSNIQ